MTDNKNPLNIRPGDVLEYTGASWTGSFQGRKGKVVRVSEDLAFYEGGNLVELVPPPGHEFIVHYAVQDGDQYRYIHAGMAGDALVLDPVVTGNLAVEGMQLEHQFLALQLLLEFGIGTAGLGHQTAQHPEEKAEFHGTQPRG